MSRYELRYVRRDGKTQTKPVNFQTPYEAQRYLDASREALILELGYDPKVELLRLEEHGPINRVCHDRGTHLGSCETHRG